MGIDDIGHGRITGNNVYYTMQDYLSYIMSDSLLLIGPLVITFGRRNRVNIIRASAMSRAA
jgi:hypothetical protein